MKILIAILGTLLAIAVIGFIDDLSDWFASKAYSMRYDTLSGRLVMYVDTYTDAFIDHYKKFGSTVTGLPPDDMMCVIKTAVIKCFSTKDINVMKKFNPNLDNYLTQLIVSRMRMCASMER